MIKLIASDLDGTLLLNGAQALQPEVFDLILELKKRGIHFVAASGRQYASQRNLFAPIADEISYIAENGAVCIHNGELISTSAIDPELVLRIFEALEHCPNCKPLVSCLDCCYIYPGDDDYLHHIRDEVHNVVETIDDFKKLTQPILKIAVMDTKTPKESAAYLKDLFDGEIKVVTSGMEWIDFIPLHSNKGTALKSLMDKLHISSEEIISFGDQQNDLEMLHLTGKSYAMATSSDEVKSSADAVTETVEEVLRELL